MRARRTMAVGVVALVALAGCSGGGDDGAGTGGGGTTTEETTAPDDTTEETTEPDDTATDDAGGIGGEVGIEVGSTSLGDVLVDSEGMSLYMFDPDEQGESTCYDECATAWPPLVVDGEPTVGEGLDEGLVGTVERDDGTMQVTYNDWPLYYWQDDEAPGDVTGQAVNDVWWVVGPDGEPIRTAADEGGES